MDTWLWALGSVFLISLVSLIGVVTLSVRKKLLKELILFLVSLATGTLFGDAFLHLLPETFEVLGTGWQSSFMIIAGILIFFVLEKFVRWRHCHDMDCSVHKKHLVSMNIFGDAVHNFIDGLIIGASYTVSLPIGIATTLAVVLHEIPQEMGDFGILLFGGLSVNKALMLNFLVACTAFLGAIISLFLGQQSISYAHYLLPFTAGGFIYIAGSDLIPELHHETDIRISLGQFLCQMNLHRQFVIDFPGRQ